MATMQYTAFFKSTLKTRYVYVVIAIFAMSGLVKPISQMTVHPRTILNYLLSPREHTNLHTYDSPLIFRFYS
jgi:hypothetical protein